jgi:hypothetical protein
MSGWGWLAQWRHQGWSRRRRLVREVMIGNGVAESTNMIEQADDYICTRQIILEVANARREVVFELRWVFLTSWMGRATCVGPRARYEVSRTSGSR